MTTRIRRSEPTVLELPSNDPGAAKKQWLFCGLEAFVKAGDALDDYHSLAHHWTTFWPHGIDDGRNRNHLNWSTAAHALFLDYRDKLRKVWTGDSEAQLSSVLAYLLGIIRIDEFTKRQYVLDVDFDWFEEERCATFGAWQLLKQSHPKAEMQPPSIAFPQWGLGNFHYLPKTDFQFALWLLSREDWRARLCGQCKRCFIADKAAQRYCSTRCYGEAKRGQRTAWWNKAGKKKRAQRESVRSAKRNTGKQGKRSSVRGPK